MYYLGFTFSVYSSTFFFLVFLIFFPLFSHPSFLPIEQQQGVPTPMESLRSHPLAGGATDPLDNTVTDETSSETTTTSSSYAANSGPLKQVMDKVFGTSSQREVKFSALDASAKKVAPKIFFAGERTFLAWMEAGVYLAGLSMALGTYADVGSVSDWFAVVLHPVAIGMIFYSMYQCTCHVICRALLLYIETWYCLYVLSDSTMCMYVFFLCTSLSCCQMRNDRI